MKVILVFSDKARAETEYRKLYDKIAVLASQYQGFGVTYLTELFIEALNQVRKEAKEEMRTHATCMMHIKTLENKIDKLEKEVAWGRRQYRYKNESYES